MEGGKSPLTSSLGGKSEHGLYQGKVSLGSVRTTQNCIEGDRFGGTPNHNIKSDRGVSEGTNTLWGSDFQGKLCGARKGDWTMNSCSSRKAWGRRRVKLLKEGGHYINARFTAQRAGRVHEYQWRGEKGPKEDDRKKRVNGKISISFQERMRGDRIKVGGRLVWFWWNLKTT